VKTERDEMYRKVDAKKQIPKKYRTMLKLRTKPIM
jgi:hypothetical protein